MNDSHRAGRVGAVADLVAISLRSVNARLPEVDANDGAIDLDLSWESSHRLPDPTSLLYGFRMSIGSTSGKDLHVECEFELAYHLPEGFEVNDEDLTAFGQISATFSAFPYARELVQSLTTRASLAPLVLGVLRAPIDPPVVDASD